MGGALLLVVSPQTVFVVNGAVSLCAMFILLTLPANIRPIEQGDASEKRSMLADVMEGFSVVLQKPALWVTIGLAAVGFFLRSSCTIH